VIDWDDLVVGATVAIFGDGTDANPRPFRYVSAAGVQWIDGVFDDQYLAMTPLGHGGLESEMLSLGAPGVITTSTPVLGVQLSQFRRPPEQGAIVEIRGTTYAVREVRSDGHGWAKLLLNEA
jgi:hypothetical protein